MWVMTSGSYTSAVAIAGRPGMLMVRARDLESLLRFASLGGETDEGARERAFQDFPCDYPWRLEMSKEEYADCLLGAAADIEYTNFKNEATRVRGSRYHDFLLKVWNASQALTSRRDVIANDRAWDAGTVRPSVRVPEPDEDVHTEQGDWDEYYRWVAERDASSEAPVEETREQIEQLLAEAGFTDEGAGL